MTTDDARSRMRAAAPVIVRVGVALVFLWFGVVQLHNPSVWTGFVPSWIASTSIDPAHVIVFNGVFEIVFGLALLVGVFVRTVSLLLALHLFGIAYLARGDIGVRDFGLAMATLGTFCFGPDMLCLNRFFKKNTSVSEPETGAS